MSDPLAGHVRVWYDVKNPGRCVSDAELRYGPELKAVFMTGILGLVALVGAVGECFRLSA